MNYKEYVYNVTNNSNISEEEIFNFVDTPLEFACATIIEGYNRIIQSVEDNWGIGKCICFISNVKTPNAKAISNNKSAGIIEIHMGLVRQWKEQFLENNKINSDSLIKSRFGYLKTNYNYEVGISLFITASLYTLYHEIAHIIQFKGLEEKESIFIEEYKYGIIVSKRHILEIDADLFSSLSISEHIIYNILNKKNLTKDDEQFIGDIIALNAAAIFLTILTFSKSIEEFYINKHSHPHPTLRNAATTSQFFTQLLEYTKQKNIEIKISEESIVEGIFVIINHLFDSSERISIVKQINLENRYDIEKYYQKVLIEIEQAKWSATYKRDLIQEGKAQDYS